MLVEYKKSSLFSFSVPVLLVLLARIVKLTLMTVPLHRCVTMASVKMESTTSLVTAMLGIQEGFVTETLMIVRVGTTPFKVVWREEGSGSITTLMTAMWEDNLYRTVL